MTKKEMKRLAKEMEMAERKQYELLKRTYLNLGEYELAAYYENLAKGNA